MANGDNNMSGTNKTVTAVGGVSIVVIVTWLLVIGTYKARVDQLFVSVKDIGPRVHASEVVQAEIRGEVKMVQAETQQMFGEVMRRLSSNDAKLDRIIESR